MFLVKFSQKFATERLQKLMEIFVEKIGRETPKSKEIFGEFLRKFIENWRSVNEFLEDFLYEPLKNICMS